MVEVNFFSPVENDPILCALCKDMGYVWEIKYGLVLTKLWGKIKGVGLAWELGSKLLLQVKKSGELSLFTFW